MCPYTTASSVCSILIFVLFNADMVKGFVSVDAHSLLFLWLAGWPNNGTGFVPYTKNIGKAYTVEETVIQ